MATSNTRKSARFDVNEVVSRLPERSSISQAWCTSRRRSPSSDQPCQATRAGWPRTGGICSTTCASTGKPKVLKEQRTPGASSGPLPPWKRMSVEFL